MGLMGSGNGKSCVVGVAAITDEHVADQQVEDAVDQPGADEDRPGQPWQVPELKDKKADKSQHEDADAQPVWEVFLPEQLAVAAHQARRQHRVGLAQMLRVTAGEALPLGRTIDGRLTGHVTLRAREDDLHSGYPVFSRSNKL